MEMGEDIIEGGIGEGIISLLQKAEKSRALT